MTFEALRRINFHDLVNIDLPDCDYKNWLRHGSKTAAGKMDEMLFYGATVEQLAKGAKTTKASVYVHLNHLRKVHKLAVVKKDGVFTYDVERMNGKKKAAGNKKRG